MNCCLTPIENQTLQCQKCSKSIPHHHVKIHSKYCRGRCPIHPILAALFLSRINMFTELRKLKEAGEDEITCHVCHESLEAKISQDHVYECTQIEIDCPYCKKSFLAKQTEAHLEKCLPQFSSDFITRRDDIFSQKLKGDTSTINPQREILVERLMGQLRIPVATVQKIREDIGERVTFSSANDINYQSPNKQCSFCLVDFLNEEEIRKTGCGHVFHPDCLRLWSVKSDHCLVCKVILS